MFNTLHLMFMDQYTELWTALDAIAERIRSLGYPAPGTNSEFARLTSIDETPGVPDAMDISREPASVLEAYGATPGRASFANNCLLARRLSERGVRFVQLFDWGWDAHGTSPSDDILTQLPKKCRETDGPVAALIADLRQRGLLDETLVVWGGEFGRTPMAEFRDGKKDFFGRDHHPHCFTVLMAGGFAAMCLPAAGLSGLRVYWRSAASAASFSKRSGSQTKRSSHSAITLTCRPLPPPNPTIRVTASLGSSPLGN
jgi:hypothetical protein